AIQTNNLAWAYFVKHDRGTASTLFKQALAAVEAANSPRWQAVIKSNWAALYLAQDDLVHAEELLNQALAESQAVQDPENVVRTQIRRAALMMKQGLLDEAESLATESESSSKKMGFRRGQAEAVRVLADIYTRKEEQEEARRHYEEAHRLYKRLGDPTANELALLI
ncbi:MAG: tetratricopeptide repeat protein, partial [Anaerolineae bacterium]